MPLCAVAMAGQNLNCFPPLNLRQFVVNHRALILESFVLFHKLFPKLALLEPMLQSRPAINRLEYRIHQCIFYRGAINF